jgi:UDP-2-acetamido-3-amino-2,3-dideoxy-glucuronate N-acetyltransferase
MPRIAAASRSNSRLATPKVAVVGCGHWGRNLVRNYHRLGALGAVVDADPARAQEYAAQTGAPALTFAELLQRAEVDAVALATPAETHAPMALSALGAGKHVFVEKPLALSVPEGRRILERALAAGRVLMVGHLLRYHPAFLQLQRLIDGGQLGRLQYIYSNRLNLGRIPARGERVLELRPA